MNINPNTTIFIKNIMLGAGDINLSLTNPNHVQLAVEKAYIAMSPRTLGKGKQKGAKISAKNKANVFSQLAATFVAYFDNNAPLTQADFDAWHNKTCCDFLKNFNSVLRTSNYAKRMGYGKAQKIVNMTFKYLYLYDQASGCANNHFSFCHFTLDNYTLKWYKNDVCCNYTLGSWSNMCYHKYMTIQENIRAYLPTQSKYPKDPFYAEFKIWSDYAF